MTGLAVLALVVSAAVLGGSAKGLPAPAEEHGEAHADADPHRAKRPHPKRRRYALRTAQVIGVAAAVAVLLVVPPATLTAQSMSHRADTGELRDAPRTTDTVEGELGIRELALLLRQQDSTLLIGRNVEVAGFVMPDATDPENVFVVTRYAITCCAVDAQPLGVPVLHPGWHQSFTEGEWVQASGVFTVNPNAVSTWPAVLLPGKLTPIEEPEDPYVS